MPKNSSKPSYAYGSFRRSFDSKISILSSTDVPPPTTGDHRILCWGMRAVIEKYLLRRWTLGDVEEGEDFFSHHFASTTSDNGMAPFPYPKDLFMIIVNDYKGYFPIRVETVLEGTVVYPHCPVLQISTHDVRFNPLVTWFESVLSHVWYPVTVCTQSRRIKDLLLKAAAQSSTTATTTTVDFQLHDFGLRACTTVEQAIIGGSAHLVNFKGSDNCPAAAWLSKSYKFSKKHPIPAVSIPATEHSVMLSHPTERKAIMAALNEWSNTGAFAVVMDTYNYTSALEDLLPGAVLERGKENVGFMVVRPDSGDPVTTVLQALRAIEKCFGYTTNSKGYKVINGASVLQGDGCSYGKIEEILQCMLKEGYSSECCSFGMGGALLQRDLNRDTLGWAIKLSEWDGRAVSKRPLTTDPFKCSLPGILGIYKNPSGSKYVDAVQPDLQKENFLRVVYDCGPCNGEVSFWKSSFEDVRKRAEEEWATSPAIPTDDVIGSSLREKISLFDK